MNEAQIPFLLEISSFTAISRDVNGGRTISLHFRMEFTNEAIGCQPPGGILFQTMTKHVILQRVGCRCSAPSPHLSPCGRSWTRRRGTRRPSCPPRCWPSRCPSSRPRPPSWPPSAAPSAPCPRPIPRRTDRPWHRGPRPSPMTLRRVGHPLKGFKGCPIEPIFFCPGPTI